MSAYMKRQKLLHLFRQVDDLPEDKRELVIQGIRRDLAMLALVARERAEPLPKPQERSKFH